jgi:hypothetical protein
MPSGHTHATLERIRAPAEVLWGQDTPLLDDGRTQPKEGLGTVKITVREAYLLHPTVAFTPERMTLGVLGMTLWQRPEQPWAQERRLPRGEAPMEWRLRTSLPVADFPSAWTGVPWSRWRWKIELCFQGRKHGCQLEPCRVPTEQRWLNAMALYLIVAWRIHPITMAGRAYPEAPCEVVFAPQE